MKRRQSDYSEGGSSEQMDVGDDETSQNHECGICHKKFDQSIGLKIHMGKVHKNKRQRFAAETPNATVHEETAAPAGAEAMNDVIGPTVDVDPSQTQIPTINIEWGI